MSTYDPSKDERLRQAFKQGNRLMLLMWRLGMGGIMNMAPDVVGRIMVITHTGRKSGLKWRTPLNYAVVDGELYCTAGFGALADWYRNIKANPQVEVWLPDSWYAGEAQDVTDSPERLAIMRQVLIGSGVVAPMFGIQPKTMSDAELAQVTADYRLVHIRRTAPRTGPGGPGDLTWVWMALTLKLLVYILLRPRKR